VRYRANGREVRSENAAQATTHRARFLEHWIREHKQVKRAVDYGCGKLRYSSLLVERCESLTLVDSAIQLDRIQPIAGQTTTIRKWVATNLPSAHVQTVDEFSATNTRHQLILCSNVLSAIPSYKERRLAVERIGDHLAHNGHALFVTQFRDTYFTRMRTSDRATPYLDGWLVDSIRGTCFYGLLPVDRLVQLVVRSRLHVEKAWKHEKSAYVLARLER
jgi:hypothetical protein